MARIAYVEPFEGGSHAAFGRTLTAGLEGQHEFTSFSLPAGSTAPAGGAFWTRKLGAEDKFGFGLGLASVSAAIMEYEEPTTFGGRYWAQKVELLTISALPSFAYKVNDHWSVSFGVPIMFGQLDMDVAVARVDADAVEGGEVADCDLPVRGENRQL